MRIVIVTGASSGIGREFVKQIGHFYKNLDEIWVIARRRERLEQLRNISAVPIRIFDGDLLHKQVYVQLKKALLREHPDVRMLVNAAGFGKSGTVEDILEEDRKIQLQMIDLNCIALSRMTFTCMPYLTRGSRIINLASAAAFSPQPQLTVYAATKSYVLSFSRGLGAELREKGICVTAVCPGPVETEFFDVAGELQNVFKKMTLVKAPDVVRKALLDSRAGKSISVYGLPIKAAHAAAKILPTDLVVRVIG